MLLHAHTHTHTTRELNHMGRGTRWASSVVDHTLSAPAGGLWSSTRHFSRDLHIWPASCSAREAPYWIGGDRISTKTLLKLNTSYKHRTYNLFYAYNIFDGIFVNDQIRWAKPKRAHILMWSLCKYCNGYRRSAPLVHIDYVFSCGLHNKAEGDRCGRWDWSIIWMYIKFSVRSKFVDSQIWICN